MFERLTPEHGWKDASYDTWEICGLDHVCKRDCWKPIQCEIPKMLYRLAAYEDSGLSPEEVQELSKAKAEGRLVVLPCKPETKVYRVWKVDGREPVIDEYYAGLRFMVDNLDNFGKTVFLSREAAEKAIMETKRAVEEAFAEAFCDFAESNANREFERQMREGWEE